MLFEYCIYSYNTLMRNVFVCVVRVLKLESVCCFLLLSCWMNVVYYCWCGGMSVTGQHVVWKIFYCLELG